MSIEYVSRHLSFENLLVEVTVQRWICESCGRRECFHDSHEPYNEHVPSPNERGWRLGITMEDGDQQPCWCRKCAEESDAREAARRPLSSPHVEPATTAEPHRNKNPADAKETE